MKKQRKLHLVGMYCIILFFLFFFFFNNTINAAKSTTITNSKKNNKILKNNKITWWQDHRSLYINIYTDAGKKCKHYMAFTNFQLIYGCKAGKKEEDDKPIYRLNFREEVIVKDEVNSKCTLAANNKYYSCSLVKKYEHFFDQLFINPVKENDDINKFKVTKNWEMWQDYEDETTSNFFQYFDLKTEMRLISFTEDILKKEILIRDIIILYINFPYSRTCLKSAIEYSNIYNMFDSVKEMTFGWMNAMENIEFASRFDISPEKCNMYVWRQDDNKTMPSIINIAGDDSKAISNKLVRYLTPAIQMIQTEKDLVKAYQGKSLTAIGFFDKPMKDKVKANINEFKNSCISFRDGIVQGERPASIMPLNCAMAIDNVALKLGEKYGVKHGITFFRKFSQEILTYKFKSNTDMYNLTYWLKLHSTPLISRFDWGIRGDLLIQQVVPIGMLFLGKNIDRDPGKLLGDDDTGGMDHRGQIHGNDLVTFTSIAKEYLGKMKFLWVGKSDFFRLTEFGISLNEIDDQFPVFVIESNASFNSKKYAMYNNMDLLFENNDDDDDNGVPSVTPEIMKDFIEEYFEGTLKETHPSGDVPKSKWIPGHIRKIVARTIDNEVVNPVQTKVKETLLFMIHRNHEDFEAITNVAATFAKLLEKIPTIMVGIMDISENHVDPTIFPNVDPNDLGASYLYLVRDGISGKSFDETLNPKKRRKKKKKKRKKFRKKTETKHIMTFLKKYSNVLRSDKSLAQILIHLDETMIKEKKRKEEMEKIERKKEREKKMKKEEEKKGDIGDGGGGGGSSSSDNDEL